MNNSPLLFLNYDISELIGFYLETIQKKKAVVCEFKETIDILQNYYNIRYLINFNKELYYERNNLFLEELLHKHKTGYIWNGKRCNEKIHKSLKLRSFKRTLNTIYIRSRYICTCFRDNCDNCDLRIDDYLNNRDITCENKGKILVALYFKNTMPFIYDYKTALCEIKYKIISKELINFKKKVYDNKKYNKTYNIDNAYNLLIDEYNSSTNFINLLLIQHNILSNHRR